MTETTLMSEPKMINYIKKNNYLVVFPDKKAELFQSLRQIQKAISVDSSTISKKLSSGEHIITAKGTGYVFFIDKIDCN